MKASKNNTNTTTTAKPAAYGRHGVNCTETPDGVTVTITGAAFRNLKKITRIFNKWDGADLTPGSMLWRECFSQNEMLMHLGEKSAADCIGETLPSVLCDTYREAPDADALRDAFAAAGFAVEM